MDGFPKTKTQITLLSKIDTKPSMVIILDCKDEICIQRLKDRKVDPVTGLTYDMVNSPPDNKEVVDRLQSRDEDDESIVKKRLEAWEEFVGKVEDAYKDIMLTVKTDNITSSEISDAICEAIQNPIF